MDKMKEVIIDCGKGGVGKSTTAAALATLFATRGKTVFIDYDGGCSGQDLLGVKGFIPPNTLHKIGHNLYLGIVKRVKYKGITEVKKEKGYTFEKYFSQFKGDHGIVLLADMVTAFFGVPTDTHSLQKFITLVMLLQDLRREGFEHVVIDVEPTAGFEQLMFNAQSTTRSLRNLKDTGRFSLLTLGVKWPDIAKYVGSKYIKEADVFAQRIEDATAMLVGAKYLLVCKPEAMPVDQTFDVREIIEGFGGVVHGCVINDVRGEKHERKNINRLTQHGLPTVSIHREPSFHDEDTNRHELLLKIGHKLSSIL